MSQAPVFDQAHYDRLNASRGAVVRRLLSELVGRMGLRTAIDVGSGLGHFSDVLSNMGFQVRAVEGRWENVEESRKRYPKISFEQFNIEDPSITQLGRFDLVFCFGLLYHLENPFLAIRNLYAMSQRMLFVEGLIYPGDEPVMCLIDETSFEDQGLHNYAFYPTEACLVKMMYRAGFRNVYGLRRGPDQKGYRGSLLRPKFRTMLAAFHQPVESDLLMSIPEPFSRVRPWEPELATSRRVDRFRHFMNVPMRKRFDAIKRLIGGT